MLTHPRYAGWTIAAIVLEAGFSDLSPFNVAVAIGSPIERAAVGGAMPA